MKNWKDLLSNAGDKMHPTDVFSFFSNHMDTNSRFEFPSRALHQLDLCLPLHFIFFLLEHANAETCSASKPFEVEFKTEIPSLSIDYMQSHFRAVLQEIQCEGPHANFKWKNGELLLNDKQVEALVAIDRYGLGNRFMGKVAINVDRNYKYRPGERPWFHYENTQEYSEQQVGEHWRISTKLL